jgi:hypothetical protein
MAKTVEYTTRANELMVNAHHECFIAMQKLLVDARANKIVANDARRRARPSSVHIAAGNYSAAAATTIAGDDSVAAADDESAAAQVMKIQLKDT